MKAIGRVRKPSVNDPPRKVSRIPASCSSHIGTGGMVGIWAGIGGNPNIFIVPDVKNMSPATILRMLSIRSVHGDPERSNIDMRLALEVGWMYGITTIPARHLAAGIGALKNS
jgi:hypothetical protein